MDDTGDLTFNASGLARAMRYGETDAYLRTARRKLDDAAWTAFADNAVSAHRRGGEVDLVNLLKGDPSIRVGFATQQLVERAVPACTPDFDDVLEMVADAAARGGDGVPYWLLSGLARWCELSAMNAAAALDAVRDGRAPKTTLHTVVAAGMKIDRSRFLPITAEMLDTQDVSENETAANLLGRVEDLDSTDRATAIDALQVALRRATGDRVQAPLRALLAIAVRDPAAAAIGVAALDDVTERLDRHVREAIAMEMMFGSAKADPALTAAALAVLHDTGADEASTIEGIDHILAQNLSGHLAADVDHLADRMLGNAVATLARLDSYKHHLLADDTGALRRAVTRWLLADTIPLYQAVRDVCQAIYSEPLTFKLDFSCTGLTPERAVRICRRACGVLFLSPEAAASIIVSMMRTGPAEAMPALAATLWDPLLINYWTGPRKYLEAVMPELNQRVAEAVASVIAKLDRYSENVGKARNIPELRPSQHQRHIAAIKRHGEQLAIEKAAREGSIFSVIAATSIVMFGDSAVYDVVTEPGKSIRQESRMGVHEYSHELPRLDIIDPFGTWYQRAHMVKDGGEE